MVAGQARVDQLTIVLIERFRVAREFNQFVPPFTHALLVGGIKAIQPSFHTDLVGATDAISEKTVALLGKLGELDDFFVFLLRQGDQAIGIAADQRVLLGLQRE